MYKDIKVKYSSEFARYTDAVLVTGDVNAYRIVFETPWELDGCNFKVTAKRADGKVVTDLGTTEGTKAMCVLANSVYSVVGDLIIQLTLIDDTGTVLTACEVTAYVTEGNGDGVPAENLTPILDKVVERITILEAEMIAAASNLTNGEAKNSINQKEAKAISEGAVAFGKNSIAGSKCFNITAFDNTNKTYTLDSVEGLAIGDVFSLKLDWNFDDVGKITDINGNVVTVDNYQADQETSTVKYFRVPLKPECGTTDFGSCAVAEGYETVAAGDYSHAEGYQTHADGQYAHAEGKDSKAGYAAHAEGELTKATGTRAHAEGMDTEATGHFSHAEGYRTKALGQYSHTEGFKVIANGSCSHAEGNNSEATGTNSHAEGNNTNASGRSSHAEGYGTKASGQYQHAQGKYNIEDTANKYAHILGNGKSDTTRSNAHTIDWDGNAWYAGDVTVTVNGSEIKMSEINESMVGKKTANIGEIFNSYGGLYPNTATGKWSHAEGVNTKAYGQSSHAEGDNTIANGSCSHAEGSKTEAGYISHAEGENTKATGTRAHAEGMDTEATGHFSHAEGYGTKASGQYQHVQGKYNIEGSKSTYAHIVGNGTSDTARSNAHTLDWSGNAWFAGHVEATEIWLHSPGNKLFRLTVDDNGTLTTVKIDSNGNEIIDID